MPLWTNSARSRIGQNGLTESMILSTFNSPESNKPGKIPGSTEYMKKFDTGMVSVVTKKTDRGEWLIITCWINSFRPTSNYSPGQYISKGNTFWEKVWNDVKQMFGFKV